MIIISCRPVFVNMKMDVQRNPSESVSVHIRRIIYTFPVDFIAEKHIIESSNRIVAGFYRRVCSRNNAVGKRMVPKR